jgi:hypothetical protein
MLLTINKKQAKGELNMEQLEATQVETSENPRQEYQPPKLEQHDQWVSTTAASI